MDKAFKSMNQSLTDILTTPQTGHSQSLSTVMAILVACIGVCLMIWHREISITWWKYIIRENDRVFPGLMDKFKRIGDLGTPEKSWWVTLWGCILIVVGLFSFLVAYVIAFGSIEYP